MRVIKNLFEQQEDYYKPVKCDKLKIQLTIAINFISSKRIDN